jgi:2-polyprenyl-6-methoxyphenol hydroxylase-like FAD-dependent oxidoreductase
METVGQHAIIIGSGIAGLLAARVLSGHFERVTLLERDETPTFAAPRKGIPQGRHAHGLLSTGWRTLQRFFNGIEGELLEAGARVADATGGGLWFQHGGFLTRTHSDLPIAFMSRPLLENTLRRRVQALGNVSTRTGVRVDGLVSAVPGRVTGVWMHRDGERTLLEANLIVDASGRGSRCATWLEALQYPKPEVSEVKVDLGYASRAFRQHPDTLPAITHLIIACKAPHQRRGGVLLVQEHSRWMVTLHGMLGDHPPTDERGFLEFARSLPTPDLHDAIVRAEPLSEIVSYRFPSSLRRHYERLPRFPEGLLVFGDAMCSFNPIFGQGMTVACLEAEALEASLTSGMAGLWQRFKTRVAKIVDIPWSLAAGADLAFPDTQGRRGPQVTLINTYLAQLFEGAWSDEKLVEAFHQVSNLRKPPSSLFAPSVVWRVMRRKRGLEPRMSGHEMKP